MKKLKTIIGLVLVAAMVFALTGCGGTKQEAPVQDTPAPVEDTPTEEPAETPKPADDAESLGNAENIAKKDVVGSYEILSMSGAENDVSDEDLELMKGLGLVVTLDVYDDGEAIMDVFGEEIAMTYDMDRLVVTLKGMECAFTYENKLFELVEGDSTMVFTKVSDTPKSRDPLTIEDLVGYYEQAAGQEVTLSVYEDGTGILTQDGEHKEIEFDMDYQGVVVDGERYDISMVGEKLSFSGGTTEFDALMNFNRVDEDPADRPEISATESKETDAVEENAEASEEGSELEDEA